MTEVKDTTVMSEIITNDESDNDDSDNDTLETPNSTDSSDEESDKSTIQWEDGDFEPEDFHFSLSSVGFFPGMTAVESFVSEYDYFQIFFGVEIIKTIVDQTNLYHKAVEREKKVNEK